MGISVLLVGASAGSVSSIEAAFKRNGCGTACCDSGDAALSVLAGSAKFDLIVYGVPGPSESAALFCSRLKTAPRTAGIPVLVAASANQNAAQLIEALGAGAAGVLNIDLPPASIEAALSVFLGQTPGAASPANGIDGDLKALLKEYSALSHAVNNPLQAILANTDLLSLRLPDDSPLKKYTQSITECGERVSKLVFDASQKAKAVLGNST